MNFLIALTILASASGVLSLTDDQPQLEDQYAKECIEATGADPNVVAAMKNGDFSINDEKTRCYVKCLFEKVEVLDSAGNLNETVARKIMSEHDDEIKVETAIENCKYIKGECPCETAFKLYECYHANRDE